MAKRTKVDGHGVRQYLEFMLSRDGRLGDYTYSILEEKFGLTPYSEPGNRAKKLWQRFKKSGKTVREYYDRRFTNNDLKTGGDAFHAKPPDETPEDFSRKSWEIDEDQNVANFEGSSSQVIKTVDQLIKFSGVDLSVWKVGKTRFGTWTTTMKIDNVPVQKTNYTVKAEFIRRNPIVPVVEDPGIKAYEEIIEKLDKSIKKIKLKKRSRGKRTGVLTLSDFHIGAEVKDLIRTPDFDLDILVEHLRKIADKINSLGYDRVHVNMLGDYFESISGLNHLNTFKSLQRGGYGAQIIIMAAKILTDFFSNIDNLVEINMISGNHDRVTIQKTVDNEGAAAELLSYMLDRNLDGVDVNYHGYCLTKEIDGVGYILTHGHFAMNKKPTANVIQKYGIPNLYNLWLQGHLHTRKTERTWTKTPVHYESMLVVGLDEDNYRKITVPSVFTGNFYSETLGYTTAGGFLVMENNGSGKPNVFDFVI